MAELAQAQSILKETLDKVAALEAQFDEANTKKVTPRSTSTVGSFKPDFLSPRKELSLESNEHCVVLPFVRIRSTTRTHDLIWFLCCIQRS